MPYLPIYDSADQIPADVKALYKQRADGKWVFKEEEFPGLADQLNPALAANRDAILGEKRTAEQQLTAANARANQAEGELVRLKQPGSIVLGPDDAKAWNRFNALGSVKDVEAKITEHGTLKTELDNYKQEGSLRDAASKGGYNFDVLNDRVRQDPNKPQIFVKVIETTNAKGEKASINQVFVKRIVPGEAAGSTKELEEGLETYAAANWPEYAVKSLKVSGQPAAATAAQPFTPRVPAATQTATGGQAAAASSFDPVELAKQLNEQRNQGAKVNPFAPTAAAT